MATVRATIRKAVKRPAAKVARTSKAAPVGATHKAFLAGIGAANRIQDNAVKAYGALASEAKRLAGMTTLATESLAKKASALVGEGKKIQSTQASLAEKRAAALANEIKTFAAKSEKAFKQNIEGGFANAVAGAKDGVSNIEQIFESRVAKTLNTFGIPSAKDVRLLQARMADLQKALNQLNKRGVRA